MTDQPTTAVTPNRRARRRNPTHKHPNPRFARPLLQQTCRICGCTNERACLGGCHWIQEDLCSECQRKLDEAAHVA